MELKSVLVILALCLVAGCKKEPERESFFLAGNVSDCRSGQPLSRASVNIVASDASFGGFFSNNNQAGDAYTDDQGNFSIAPLYFSFTKYFKIKITKSGYAGESAYPDRDPIVQSGKKVWMLDSFCLSPL